MTVSSRVGRAIAVSGVLVSIALALCGCCDPVSCDSEDGEFSYPLAVGNRWEYSREVWISFPRSLPRPQGALDEITYYSDCIIEVVRTDSLSPTQDAYVLLETVIQDTLLSERERWYTNELDGLYFHAYQPGTFAVSPKVRPGDAPTPAEAWQLAPAGIMELVGLTGQPHAWDPDSLIYEDPPLRTLPYPPERGYEWLYREPGNPWHINKRITGTAQIEVPAGSFDCYEIQWLSDFHADGQWDDDLVMFDYVSREGLVLRSLYQWIWIVSEYGDTLGLYQMRERAELTRVDLE